MTAATPLADLWNDVLECLESDTVPLITGPAGVGKTSMLQAVAAHLGWKCLIRIGSAMDPTDITGVPWVFADDPYTDYRGNKHNRVRYAQQEALIELNIAAARDGGALLLWDELTSVTPTVQAPMLQCLNGRTLGDMYLHPAVRQVALCNPTSEAVNGQELAGPMNNRLTHFDFPVDDAARMEWCDQFPRYWGHAGPIGKRSAESLIRARAAVAAFVLAHPDQWLAKPVNGNPLPPAYPSPRSLERASRHLAGCYDKRRDPSQCLRLMAGEIGVSSAAALQGYLSKVNLPDPEALLADPDSFTPTGRIDYDYSCLSGVWGAFETRKTLTRYHAAWRLVHRAVDKTKQDRPAYEAGMALVNKLQPLCNGPAVLELAKNDPDIKGDKAVAVVKIQHDIGRLAKPYRVFFDNLEASAKQPA